jgi:hypothetical protein
VNPGQEVPLYVVMQRFGQAEEVRTVRVPIPPSTAGSDVDIEVAAGDRVSPELPVPRSLDDLLENLRHDYPATTLVATLRAPNRGAVLRGHVVRDLPPSVLDTLIEVNDSDRPQTVVATRRFEFPMGRVLSGTARVRVRVREVPR